MSFCGFHNYIKPLWIHHWGVFEGTLCTPCISHPLLAHFPGVFWIHSSDKLIAFRPLIWKNLLESAHDIIQALRKFNLNLLHLLTKLVHSHDKFITFWPLIWKNLLKSAHDVVQVLHNTMYSQVQHNLLYCKYSGSQWRLYVLFSNSCCLFCLDISLTAFYSLLTAFTTC